MFLTRKIQGRGHKQMWQFNRAHQLQGIYIYISMQSNHFVLISMTNSKLKCKGWPKLLFVYVYLVYHITHKLYELSTHSHGREQNLNNKVNQNVDRRTVGYRTYICRNCFTIVPKWLQFNRCSESSADVMRAHLPYPLVYASANYWKK